MIPSDERGRPLEMFYNLKWLNVKEASKYLRVSPESLRRRVQRRQIKFYRLGQQLRFKKSDLDDLLESNSNKDFQ